MNGLYNVHLQPIKPQGEHLHRFSRKSKFAFFPNEYLFSIESSKLEKFDYEFSTQSAVFENPQRIEKKEREINELSVSTAFMLSRKGGRCTLT